VRIRTLLLSAALLVPIGLASTGHATTIHLSQFSSDSTPADLLDATLEFEVVGNTLALTVTNLTADPSAYNMSRIFFNGSEAVAGLVLVSALHSDPTAGPGLDGDVTALWSLAEDKSVPPFGTFDFRLAAAGTVATASELIGPGENVLFTFTILGVGPLSDEDFVDLSENEDPEMRMLAAAKFRHGPDFDHAFGASSIRDVPEPAALALLGSLAALAARRRR
jgi:hypothetical protein